VGGAGQNAIDKNPTFYEILKSILKPLFSPTNPGSFSEDPSFWKLSPSKLSNILSERFSNDEYKPAIRSLYESLKEKNLEAYLHEGREKIYFNTPNQLLFFTINLKYSKLSKITHKIQKVRSYVSGLWEKE